MTNWSKPLRGGTKPSHRPPSTRQWPRRKATLHVSTAHAFSPRRGASGTNLCNAGTELKFRQDRYERAIDWLKAVQRGDVSPDLPDRDAEEDTGNDAPIGPIAYGSNPKRCQHQRKTET